MVTVDISGAAGFFDSIGPDYGEAAAAHRKLSEATGPGSEFTGWLNLPQYVMDNELKKILHLSKRICEQSEALVVIGVGGSCLGARAGVELLRGICHNTLNTDYPNIYFVGNNLSPEYNNEIIAMLGDRDFSINVISKSGATLEPAIAFRIFKNLLEKKYGHAGARRRIIATTDANDGVLKRAADSAGYECLVIPDDVGGRYSGLSAVGLLPMSVAGVDIARVLSAAAETFRELTNRSPENPAWQYAAVRQHLYKNGRQIEILASYEPSFRSMAEWWKQLYGESEGKNGVGIFPASADFTGDLHSLGQYIQDGPRHLLETVVGFEKSSVKRSVPFEIGDADSLNYLAGHDLHTINRTVAEAVKNAHISGGVPVINIDAKAKNEEGFASLVCFFELACAISGYMSGVNPFDQPGVESYKSSMRKFLSELGNP